MECCIVLNGMKLFCLVLLFSFSFLFTSQAQVYKNDYYELEEPLVFWELEGPVKSCQITYGPAKGKRHNIRLKRLKSKKDLRSQITLEFTGLGLLSSFRLRSESHRPLYSSKYTYEGKKLVGIKHDGYLRFSVFDSKQIKNVINDRIVYNDLGQKVQIIRFYQDLDTSLIVENWEYNDLGQLILYNNSVRRGIDGELVDWQNQIKYEYNDKGELISLKKNCDDKSTEYKYAYDEQSRLTEIYSRRGKLWDKVEIFVYDSLQAVGSGKHRMFNHFPFGGLNVCIDKSTLEKWELYDSTGKMIESNHYEKDSLGWVTIITSCDYDEGGICSRTALFYDERGRIKSEHQQFQLWDGEVLGEEEKVYYYDRGDNWIKMAVFRDGEADRVGIREIEYYNDVILK